MFAAFQHRFEARTEGQGGFAGARPSADGHDADGGIHQHVDGQPLLGRASVQPEDVTVTLDQPDLLVGTHPAQGRTAVGEEHQAGVDRHFRGCGDEDRLVAVEGVDFVLAGFHLGNARPAGVLHQFVAVFVGREAHGGGFDPHGQVLRHNGDVPAFVGQVLGHCQDAAVVVAAAEPERKHVSGDVVQLHHQRAAAVANGNGLAQAAVLHAEVIEQPEGLAGKVAQLGVVPFPLKFGDDHDGDDDLVLCEAQQCARVGEQDGGVNDEAADGGFPSGDGKTGRSFVGCTGF